MWPQIEENLLGQQYIKNKIWQKSSVDHNGLKAQYVSNNMHQHRLMGNIL